MKKYVCTECGSEITYFKVIGRWDSANQKWASVEPEPGEAYCVNCQKDIGDALEVPVEAAEYQELKQNSDKAKREQPNTNPWLE